MVRLSVALPLVAALALLKPIDAWQYRFHFGNGQRFHYNREQGRQRQNPRQQFDSGKDYYKTLGVSPGATVNDIRKAYKQLARTWHPDRNQSPEAEKTFVEISEAHEVLTDDTRRREYDQDRRGNAFNFQQRQHPQHHHSGGQRRRWEEHMRNRQQHMKRDFMDDIVDSLPAILAASYLMYIVIRFALDDAQPDLPASGEENQTTSSTRRYRLLQDLQELDLEKPEKGYLVLLLVRMSSTAQAQDANAMRIRESFTQAQRVYQTDPIFFRALSCDISSPNSVGVYLAWLKLLLQRGSVPASEDLIRSVANLDQLDESVVVDLVAVLQPKKHRFSLLSLSPKIPTLLQETLPRLNKLLNGQLPLEPIAEDVWPKVLPAT